MEDGLLQFDHALNAMLLLSYVALKQGDQVGIVGIGGAGSWFPPRRGPTVITVLGRWGGGFAEAVELFFSVVETTACAVR